MPDTIKKDAKRSFSNTVSAGLKSLGGKGKTFYVLEFKNNSQMHRAKTTKEIIVDYIELGRSPKCQIRFGEDCRTVSGVHCAIMREGENYFVKHLSKSNPTLINGHPVADKFYINSGDEITLSYGGPVIGFIVPQNNLTSSIPLTRRLSLFREQAMRPYKRAIALLSIIMILSIAGLSYSLFRQSDVMKKQEEALANLSSQRARDSIDLVKMKESGQITEEELKNKLASLQHNYNVLSNTVSHPPPPLPQNQAVDLQKLTPSVYFIKVVKIEAEIGSSSGLKTLDSIPFWSGTGFLLDDGRFVTARHVVKSWYYPNNVDEYVLNATATVGKRVVAHFKAWSPSGDVIEFTSEDFRTGETQDTREVITDSVNNTQFEITDASLYDDWAYTKTNFIGKLKSDGPMSLNLQMGTQLFTLGFPFNIGVYRNKLEPQYSQFDVSSSGISSGAINISSKSFDHGNSGGPVFVKEGSEYKVVGIISAGKGAQGLIIPISKIN